MSGLDGDDAVYASILARVERSELHDQLQKVAQKDCKSVTRQMRHMSASLTALRQLQAASQQLRPNGDWLPKRLQAQLKRIEELQRRLETAVDHLDADARLRRTKKRKRPTDKDDRGTVRDKTEEEKVEGGSFQMKDKEAVIKTGRLEYEEEESDVECLKVVAPAGRRRNVEKEEEKFVSEENTAAEANWIEDGEVYEEAVERGREIELQLERLRQEQRQEDGDSNVEMLEVVAAVARTEEDATVRDLQEEVEKGSVLASQTESGGGDTQLNAGSLSESDELPRGLVRRICDATVRVKEEPMTFNDASEREECKQVHVMYETGTDAMAESPIELEVFESSDESSVEIEMPDSEELAIELDVPDSDSEDDFSPYVELVAKLQHAEAADQLVEFPTVVEQLRLYLFESKHLAVTELDGYLFAHKRVTDEETEEIGHAIKSIICVGMTLPARPKIKLALYDLLAIVEQLECTLGELPSFLRPVVTTFSNYFLSQLDEIVDSANREPRFTVLHL